VFFPGGNAVVADTEIDQIPGFRVFPGDKTVQQERLDCPKGKITVYALFDQRKKPSGRVFSELCPRTVFSRYSTKR
jgi:hypothetical protein